MKHAIRGFTLVELLVAVAIFAVIAAMAYGGLDSVIRQRERTSDVMNRLRIVQQAFEIMANDFGQLEPRPVRDPLSQTPLAALISAPQNTPPVTFTRGGWSNPLADVRSTEQRVAYELDNDKLVRLSWPELDNPAQTPPTKQYLLTEVSEFDVSFMDNNGQWQPQWPPLNTDASAYLAQLPKAVEIDVTLKDWGRITRIIEVASQP
ncbi:MAG: type II secretion system minor pseudopilin GspJ [Gammaproteobacteria bacterium]|nr:type II secretion system minor pseudopilin GspJ [Gammaproteobacteria bacterium]